MPVVKFNYANYRHSHAKVVNVNGEGFTLGNYLDHAETEILKFKSIIDDEIIGEWTHIQVKYSGVRFIHDYAALAIKTSVYLFG